MFKSSIGAILEKAINILFDYYSLCLGGFCCVQGHGKIGLVAKIMVPPQLSFTREGVLLMLLS